ncbi:MAG: type II toxin-antitoxin system VapB family antitoxin [Desulfobacterales bacterium]|nr:type II toxin-antitoxin system VapB family antitoxin [Desulfobacterales bacterium]
MGRTNIVLDDKLVDACLKATGIKTRKTLIDHALMELLRHESQKKILELKGKIHWEGNLAEWRQGRD